MNTEIIQRQLYKPMESPNHKSAHFQKPCKRKMSEYVVEFYDSSRKEKQTRILGKGGLRENHSRLGSE